MINIIFCLFLWPCCPAPFTYIIWQKGYFRPFPLTLGVFVPSHLHYHVVCHIKPVWDLCILNQLQLPWLLSKVRSRVLVRRKSVHLKLNSTAPWLEFGYFKHKIQFLLTHKVDTEDNCKNQFSWSTKANVICVWLLKVVKNVKN